MTDRHCESCGYPNPAGRFCTQCWDRLPYQYRRLIRMYGAEEKGHARHLAVAIADAAAWLVANPGVRG